MMLNKLRFLLCLVGLAVAAPSVMAASQEGELLDTPVYYEKLDRYYELVSLKHSYPKQHSRDADRWNVVARLAEQRFHEGRRGRLVVVETPDLNRFLRDTFKPSGRAWIGLKYYCGLGQAIWVNGKPLKNTAYQNWRSPWNVGGDNPEKVETINKCPADSFLPVHYWAYRDGFQWNANGEQKAGRLFFVEYPPSEAYWD